MAKARAKSPNPLNGVFALSTTTDLLAKLEHDLGRMRRSPTDPYPAMDFFWTAEHMLDWLHPGEQNKDRRRQKRSKEVLLHIVWDIATGAKHFCVEDPNHASVRATGRATAPMLAIRYVGAGQPISRPRLREILYVTLDGDARVQYGDRFEVPLLAERVCEYWRRETQLSAESAASAGR